MTAALSAFAQKLNIASPKSLQSHANRKPSISSFPRISGIESYTLVTSLQTVEWSSELQFSQFPGSSFSSPPQQSVDYGVSPSIVYSSASCPSTTDLSTLSFSPLTNRTGSSLSGTSDGFLSSSPDALALVDNSPSSPSPHLIPEEVTLSQRRGITRLLSLRSSHNPSIGDRSIPPRPKSPFASLSPLAPRFALNRLRHSDLDSPDDKCFTDCHEGVFDPFSRASSSVFYGDGGKPSHEPLADSWLSGPEGSSETDHPEIQALSPLNDLSVYLCRPPQPHTDTPPKAKSRLHIWVSGIEPQQSTIAAQSSAQRRAPLHRGPKRKNRKPKLRPLILPNLAALREIVNAQQQRQLIVSPTCPPRIVVPQQQQQQQGVPRRALQPNGPTASPKSASADTALGPQRGRPIASLPPPPELVMSTDALPAAPPSRRLTRESISEPVIVRRGGESDGDRSVGAAPRQAQTNTVIERLTQSQCHCSVPVPHEPGGQQSQGRYPNEALWLQHEHEAELHIPPLRLRQNCDKPLPEEPALQPERSVKPLPRDPLCYDNDKPLPLVPPEDRLDGLIALLHQAGIIADSVPSLRALGLTCGPSSGHGVRTSVYPRMSLKGSVSMDLRRTLLESRNDKASQDHFAARPSSLWSIATQWAYAV